MLGPRQTWLLQRCLTQDIGPGRLPEASILLSSLPCLQAIICSDNCLSSQRALPPLCLFLSPAAECKGSSVLCPPSLLTLNLCDTHVPSCINPSLEAATQKKVQEDL